MGKQRGRLRCGSSGDAPGKGIPSVIEKGGKKELALCRLRRELFDGSIRAGEVITAKGIAERYGLSRTPVREAMEDLSKDGLIQWIGGAGAIVPEIGIEEFYHVLSIRYAIECVVSQELARLRDPHKVAALEKIFHEMGRVLPKADAGQEDHWAFYELDVRFHEAIARLAGNQRAQVFIRNLMDTLRLYAIENRGEPLVVHREHQKILSAIKGEGPDSLSLDSAVRRAVKAHIIGTATRWAPSVRSRIEGLD
jgi:DNA-binding GntR family transcriptional regulator